MNIINRYLKTAESRAVNMRTAHTLLLDIITLRQSCERRRKNSIVFERKEPYEGQDYIDGEKQWTCETLSQSEEVEQLQDQTDGQHHCL